MQAPIPLNDAARVAYLRQLRLDMTLPFDQIQGLCEVASRVAGAPIALVSLVDETEQRFLDRTPHCPPHWGGYRLLPERIEFWQGRSSRLHDRLNFRLHNDAWLRERLAP